MNLEIIKFIEINNFYSFHGQHKIGPFYQTTAICGGFTTTGRTDLMKAISFVCNPDVVIENDQNCSASIYFDNDLVLLRRFYPKSNRYKYEINNIVSTEASYRATLKRNNIKFQLFYPIITYEILQEFIDLKPFMLNEIFEKISGSAELVDMYNECKNDYELVCKNVKEVGDSRYSCLFNFNKYINEIQIKADIVNLKKQLQHNNLLIHLSTLHSMQLRYEEAKNLAIELQNNLLQERNVLATTEDLIEEFKMELMSNTSHINKLFENSFLTFEDNQMFMNASLANKLNTELDEKLIKVKSSLDKINENQSSNTYKTCICPPHTLPINLKRKPIDVMLKIVKIEMELVFVNFLLQRAEFIQLHASNKNSLAKFQFNDYKNFAQTQCNSSNADHIETEQIQKNINEIQQQIKQISFERSQLKIRFYELKMRYTSVAKRDNGQIRCSRLSDFCTPKYKKYEKIVNAAMYELGNPYVVETEQDAHDFFMDFNDHQQFKSEKFLILENIIDKHNTYQKIPHTIKLVDLIKIESILTTQIKMFWKNKQFYYCPKGSAEDCYNIATTKEIHVISSNATVFNKNGSFTFGNQSTEKFVAYELDINVFEEKLKKKFYETNVLHHELAQQKDLLTNMDRIKYFKSKNINHYKKLMALKEWKNANLKATTKITKISDELNLIKINLLNDLSIKEKESSSISEQNYQITNDLEKQIDYCTNTITNYNVRRITIDDNLKASVDQDEHWQRIETVINTVVAITANLKSESNLFDAKNNVINEITKTQQKIAVELLEKQKDIYNILIAEELKTPLLNLPENVQYEDFVYDLNCVDRIKIDYSAVESLLTSIPEFRLLFKYLYEQRNDIVNALDDINFIDTTEDEIQNDNFIQNNKIKLNELKKSERTIKKLLFKTEQKFSQIGKQRWNILTKFVDKFESTLQDIFSLLYRSKGAGAQVFLLYPDGEDLFLSDIKYDTIAPGQKFKKYAQLSKNEKAMSAIAMILSLFITIGGSSFIVLDGIDNILNKKEMQYLLKFLAYISNDFQVIFFSNQRKLINLIADSTTIGVVDGGETGSIAISC